VDLLSAGHGPTFLYRRSEGHVGWFGGDGLPLGIMDGERYGPTMRLQVEPGDALVLLTDGFMERMRADGEQFGLDRLTKVIGENAAHGAADLIGAIDRAVEGFAAGSSQGDDMTAVVVRRV
jgi:serine phosphatase RsbU (regulator of sigma subunit)